MATLAKATTKEIEAGGQADRRSLALQAACESAVADSQRWKRREMLVRQQIAGLTERAAQLENAAESLDAERDVLARERDALKAALTKLSRRSGYAILPYKGPTGTWQRPIVLECTAGGVKLQPQGRTFAGLELSSLIHPRSSPFVRAIARELLHIRTADTPDGAPAVPYLVFLVRPDGIRAYYEARTCLEPLGIAFGYELIEQDLVVDIPNLDDLTTWDGSVPLEMPLEPAPRSKTNVAMISSADKGGSDSTPSSADRPRGDQGLPSGWPERPIRRGRQDGWGTGNSASSNPEDFVWPGRGRSTADDGPGGAGLPRNGEQVAGNGTGPPARMAGGGWRELEGGGAPRGPSVDQEPSSGPAPTPAAAQPARSGRVASSAAVPDRALSRRATAVFRVWHGDHRKTGRDQAALARSTRCRTLNRRATAARRRPSNHGLGLSAQQAFSSKLAAGGLSPGTSPAQVKLGTALPARRGFVLRCVRRRANARVGRGSNRDGDGFAGWHGFELGRRGRRRANARVGSGSNRDGAGFAGWHGFELGRHGRQPNATLESWRGRDGLVGAEWRRRVRAQARAR